MDNSWAISIHMAYNWYIYTVLQISSYIIEIKYFLLFKDQFGYIQLDIKFQITLLTQTIAVFRFIILHSVPLQQSGLYSV